MNYKKSPVHLALASILTGAAVAVLPGDLRAQPVSMGSSGNALIFPYYTANGGWATLFNITNVSNDFLAVKVRFREQENSRDVLDFNVVMSPQDVWTGWVVDGPDGPRFYTKDKSCTSPILPVDGSGAAYSDFQSVAYTGNSSDGGSTGIERAAEGHLEVFVMGARRDGTGQGEGNWAPGGVPEYPTAYWADHAHMDCSIVDSNFRVNSGSGVSAREPSESCTVRDCPPLSGPDIQDALSGNPQARYDFNSNRSLRRGGPLKGNVSFINTARGVGAGSTAMHLERFGWRVRGRNLVTAQEYPYFLEPTLASNRGLWYWSFSITGFDHLFNEWSVNTKTGASTDWIVAFPDKYLHVDIFDDLQAGVNLVRLADAIGDNVCRSVFGGYQCHDAEVSPTLAGAMANDEAEYGTLTSVLYPFSEPFDGQSCDEVVYDLWDREENGVRGSGTSISPAPPVPASSLCYETNVLTFGGAPSVLDSRLAQTIDTSGLTSGADAGWMNIEFDNTCPFEPEGRRPCFGKFVTGFALKERDFGDPNKNFGQLMDHGYDETELVNPP